VITSSVNGTGRYVPPQICHLLVSTSVYKSLGGGGGGGGRDCVSWYWALWPLKDLFYQLRMTDE
jgi:hypothetical protein